MLLVDEMVSEGLVEGRCWQEAMRTTDPLTRVRLLGLILVDTAEISLPAVNFLCLAKLSIVCFHNVH